MSDLRDRSGFLGELKRRRVVRVGIGYAAAVFVVLQAADLIFEALEVSDGVFRALVIVSLAGFSLALGLAWLFDVTREGVRLTARRGEAGRLLSRVPPWAVFAPIAVLLLSAVAFAVAVNAPRAAGSSVKPGAEVIAVVPFDVTGTGTGMTGAGFVDLLSRNLDQVGGIRTVDPRTVLYRWEQRDEDAALAPRQTAIEIGRAVRAGSVLTGSVVVLGSEVRISADVYYADRLPPREQLLVRVLALRADGQQGTALDTLRAFLQTYPDDAEAWFLLADDEYHLQHESIAPGRARPEELLVVFDRVLALDPSFIPALIHPLEIAFRSGNRQLIEQYTTLLAAVAPSNGGTALYADAASALQTRDAAALGDALARAVAAGDSASADLSRQASLAVRLPLTAAVIALSPERRIVAMEAFDATLAGGHRDAAAAAVAHIDIALGRVTDARTRLAPLARDPLMQSGQVRSLDRLPVYAGVADSSAIRGLLLTHEPLQLEAQRLVAAIDRRDSDGARHAATAIGAIANDSTWQTIAEAGHAFATVLAGDTIAGLAQVQATLPRSYYAAGSLYDALWFRWVALLAEHPQTRARAIELLRAPWPGEPALELQRHFALGRALDAAGDPGNARIAYTVFITAVGEPDELEGRMRERALAAREALARLGSQRPSTTS